MNSLEKVSIVLMLVLIGALVASHRRQRLIDREAARIIPDYLAKQADRMHGYALMDAWGQEEVLFRLVEHPQAEGEDSLLFSTGNNNTAFGYNALDQITTGTDNVTVGDLCPKGWHLVPDREHPDRTVCRSPNAALTAVEP